jgi:hypothetical protein
MDALMGKRRPNPGVAGKGTSRIDDFAEIMGPRTGGAVDQNRMLEELSQELHDGPSVSLRLRPTLGRTVEGLYGDPGRGFRIMERKCRDNGVRSDSISQQRHVRRGQRRKDLRRSRWRKLFRVGFVAECDRIRRMRKQGW